MKLIVDITIEDVRWNGIEFEELAQSAATSTFEFLGIPDGFEISLLACNDERIKELNSEFRDKGTATNVLSWPSEERSAEHEGERPETPEPDPHSAAFGMPDELGDIAISYDTCAQEALTEGKPLSDHVTHLVVHGVLHLLGYDHIREKDAVLMEGFERDILETLSIPDPYNTSY